MDVRSDVKDLVSRWCLGAIMCDTAIVEHLHAQTGKSDPITHRVRRILAGLSNLESEIDVSG